MPLPTSPAWKRQVKYNHHIYSYARILRNGQLTNDILYVDQGNITEDVARDIRATCSVTLTAPSTKLIPATTTDLLFPGINEIKLFRGIYLADGTYEEKSLGVYGFADVDTHDTGDNRTISLEGSDRSQKVADAKFLKTYTASGSINDIILSIVSPRIPNLKYNLYASNFTVNQITFNRGDDPWKAAVALAASAGCDLFFDRDGVLQMQPLPSGVGNPDWTFLSGAEAIILEGSKKLSRSQFNHFVEIAEGSNIAVPFYGEAYDLTDVQQTGDRPYFHSSSFYTSVEQCNAAALNNLRKDFGPTEDINIQVIPNPAILLNDLILIDHPRLRVSSLYLVDRVSTPMRATQGQYIATRRRTL